MTIAGSDSGGGAGIQADLRTFAMLGMHGLRGRHRGDGASSVGVKGFHEIPLDVIAGQIEAVRSDIGVQAAKTGMLASSAIIGTIADTWHVGGPCANGPSRGGPGVCIDAAIRCCIRARWIRLGTNSFRWRHW